MLISVVLFTVNIFLVMPHGTLSRLEVHVSNLAVWVIKLPNAEQMFSPCDFFSNQFWYSLAGIRGSVSQRRMKSLTGGRVLLRPLQLRD